MIRIEIEPVWRFRKDDDPNSMLVMLDFLYEIREPDIRRAAVRPRFHPARHRGLRLRLLQAAPRYRAEKRVLAIMRGAEFHDAISALPGYAARDVGVVKPVREVFRK